LGGKPPLWLGKRIGGGSEELRVEKRVELRDWKKVYYQNKTKQNETKQSNSTDDAFRARGSGSVRPTMAVESKRRSRVVSGAGVRGVR